MKHSPLVVLLLAVFTYNASAQTNHTLKQHAGDNSTHDPAPEAPLPVGKNILVKDAAHHVGELINICDTARRYPSSDNPLAVMCLGGRYPHELLVVVVKEKSMLFPVANYLGPICIRGTIAIRNQKPVLTISGTNDILNYSYPLYH